MGPGPHSNPIVGIEILFILHCQEQNIYLSVFNSHCTIYTVKIEEKASTKLFIK